MAYTVSTNIPIFQNWLSTVNVAVTLTISYAGGASGAVAPFAVTSAANTGGAGGPTLGAAGPTLFKVIAGQTVTVTFEVPSGGGAVVATAAGGGASLVPNLTYQVEDIDWGNAG